MSLVFKTYKVIYRRDTMIGFLEQRDRQIRVGGVEVCSINYNGG